MASTQSGHERRENEDIPKTCIFKFTAVWCGPCQNPALKEALSLYKEKYNVKVKEIDVDEFPELANRYSCSSIPLFVAVKDNKEVGRCVGSSKLETLFDMIKSATKKTEESETEETENAEITNERTKEKQIENKKAKQNQIVLPILKKAELNNDADNDN